MPAFLVHTLFVLGIVAEGAGNSAPPSVPSDGAASDARSAAHAALAEGNRHLNDGDVGEAIAEYRRAQALYPESAPKIEFNIAKAEEARGDEPAAAAAFERFLSQSLEIPAEFRQEARAQLHRLAAALGTLELREQRPGLLVSVDGQVHGKTPLGGGLWVRPGRHVVTLQEGDRIAFQESIDVQVGSTVQITVTITPPKLDVAPALALPAQTPPVSVLSNGGAAVSGGSSVEVAASRPVWKRWWFWAASATAVVAGATALVLTSRSDCPVSGGCISKPIPEYPH